MTKERPLPPPGLRPRAIFGTYKFAAYIPSREEVLPLQSCFNDPFTEAVWLGRAHIADEPTLANRLMDVERVEIYLWPITQGFGKTRRIAVLFSSYRWLPLDLDNRRSEAALEWVALRADGVSDVEDLAPEDVPPALRQWFSPTHAEET